MSRRSGRRSPGSRQKQPKAEEEDGRPKPRELFAPPTKAPPVRHTRPPPVESEAMASRVTRYDVQAAVVPDELSRSLGLRKTAPLSGLVAEAASSSGYRTATKALRKAATQEANKRILEERAPEPPEIGSVSYNEQCLRRAFQYYDLDKNEMVGAQELKHIFAMFGESPTDQEIDGMIYLCDVRGNGQVAFEDFLSIFANPAESLRNIDTEALKEVVHGNPNKQESSGSEEEEQEDSTSSADSSP